MCWVGLASAGQAVPADAKPASQLQRRDLGTPKQGTGHTQGSQGLMAQLRQGKWIGGWGN